MQGTSFLDFAPVDYIAQAPAITEPTAETETETETEPVAEPVAETESLTLNPPCVSADPKAMARQAMTLDEIKAHLSGLVDEAVSVELVGSWVWLMFDTIPCRETIDVLKNIGCWWSPKHKKWYRPLSGKHFKGKGCGWQYDKITRVYGQEELKLN